MSNAKFLKPYQKDIRKQTIIYNNKLIVAIYRIIINFYKYIITFYMKIIDIQQFIFAKWMKILEH